MNIISISSFQDNYIWVLVDSNQNCIIIDPGESEPVLKTIKSNEWHLEAIFLTHHHQDHVGGVPELQKQFPQLVIYGPAETKDKGATQIVVEGENINVLGRNFFVLSTPGHTLGHLCYYSLPYLFCGDTLFSSGCGKLFEGTSSQMYESLHKLNALPEETIIYCAHEYTLANVEFAKSILPYDSDINIYYNKVKNLRTKNQKTIPVILKNERKNNLFLRTKDTVLIKKLNQEINSQQPEVLFAWLRSKRDHF